MSDTKTQTQQVLAHLETGASITPLEALKLFDCLRLGARIYDLRRRGFPIKTRTIHENGKHFASYYMLEEAI